MLPVTDVNSSATNLSLMWNSSMNAGGSSDQVAPSTTAYHLSPFSLSESQFSYISVTFVIFPLPEFFFF